MNLPPLKCDGCRACCLNEQAWIRPDMGDDPSLYETVTVGARILIAKKPGSKACRYLGSSGCTIYERRPWVCRNFDCRKYMLMKLAGTNRPERRALYNKAPWLKAVFAAATSRLKTP